MKQTVLLFLLCGLLLSMVACKDSETGKSSPALSAEEQQEEKYSAYRSSTADFFGDFASRYRQIHAMMQQGYNFDKFYYFSDDLQILKNNLQQALAMPGEHVLDTFALNYINAIDNLLPLDKKLSDYSNGKGWLEDGGAAIGSLCRQLLPLMRELAKAQRAFTLVLQQAEDSSLWATLHKYPEGSSQRYRLAALYYARRIYQGFTDSIEGYDGQPAHQQAHLTNTPPLLQDIMAFDANAKEYIASMANKDNCSVFMNNLVDFIGESHAVWASLNQGEYLVKNKSKVGFNINFVRRNNALLILKHHYFKVIESYNQGGC